MGREPAGADVAAILRALGELELPRKVLVTGGTGFVGSHLVRALAEGGHEVTCAGRNFYAHRRVRHPNVKQLPLDLSDAAAVVAACAEHELVFHIAARASPWGTEAQFKRDNVDATRHIVDGCLQAGVRLVHCSSTAIFFAYRDRKDIDDDAALAAPMSGPYAASKAEAERVVLDGVARGLDATMVRARAVFGPGDTALVPRLKQAADEGRLRQVGGDHHRVDLCYVDNLVLGLLLAAGKGKTGKAYTITNDEPVALWPLLKKLLGEFGYRTDLRQVPVKVAEAAAVAVEALYRRNPSWGEPPLTRYSVGLLGYEQTFDLSAAKEDLGYAPLVPMDEAIARTAEHARAVDETPADTQVKLRLFFTGYTTHSRGLVLRGERHKTTRFQAMFALVEHPTFGLTLFDTGYAPHFFTASQRLPYRAYRWATPVISDESASAMAQLRAEGIDPGDIQRIVISHFHADHVAGLLDFPNAELICTQRAWEHARHLTGLRALLAGFLPELLPDDVERRVRPLALPHDEGFGPFEHTWDLFGDGSVRLMELTGHAHGQLGLLAQTGPTARKLLVADACWLSEGYRGCREPHVLTRFLNESTPALRRTLKKLHDVDAHFDDVELLPTHCPEVFARYGPSGSDEDDAR